MRRLREMFRAWLRLVGRIEALAIIAFIVANGCSSSPKPKSAEATSLDEACARAITQLIAQHDAGSTCEAAMALVLQENPTCQLNFHCKKDGGR